MLYTVRDTAGIDTFSWGILFLGMTLCGWSRDAGKAVRRWWTVKCLAHEARAMTSFLLNQISGTDCPQYLLGRFVLRVTKVTGKECSCTCPDPSHDALKMYYLPLCMQRTICYLKATSNISQSYMTWWLSMTQSESDSSDVNLFSWAQGTSKWES